MTRSTTAGTSTSAPAALPRCDVVVGGNTAEGRDSTSESDEEEQTEKAKAEASEKKKKKKSINLLRGWPATSLLPAEALRQASQTALTDRSIWAPGLEYAPDPGYFPLRVELARWLGRFYGGVAPGLKGEVVDRITVTGGASQNLPCVLQSFTDPGVTLGVWAVAPCYHLACPIFEDAGFAGRLWAVPEDEEGVDLRALERGMWELENRDGGMKTKRKCFKEPGPHRKIYRHVVYCVPAFSNPSGGTMSLERRRGLVDLARRHDALVVCDDVYDMLQWRVEDTSSSPPSPTTEENIPLDKAILPRLADIDIALGRSKYDEADSNNKKHFGHVVSNGSFSKLVAPGVRTGWTYSTADFAYGLAQTGSTQSGGAASQMAATIVCELLKTTPATATATTEMQSSPSTDNTKEEEEECQLTKHISQTLRPAYARRHAILTKAIRAVLYPLGIRMRETSINLNLNLDPNNQYHVPIYGGYFIWLTLPSSSPPNPKETPKPTPTPQTEMNKKSTRNFPTAKQISVRCLTEEEEPLQIGNGELFAVHGDEDAPGCGFDDAIRLCFAWEDEEDLVEGVHRLGRVIRRMLDEGPGSWDSEGQDTGHVHQGK